MRIYAIDDEPKMLRLLRDAIREAAPEAEILVFSSAADVMEALTNSEKKPDVVFSDIEMPGMSGLTLALKIKEAAPDTRIIFVTGYDQYALEAFRVHAHGYIMKPVDAAAIREELAQILRPPKPQPQALYVQCFGFLTCSGRGSRSSFSGAKRKNCWPFWWIERACPVRRRRSQRLSGKRRRIWEKRSTGSAILSAICERPCERSGWWIC